MYYSSLKPKEPPSVYLKCLCHFSFIRLWIQLKLVACDNLYLFALVGKRGLNFEDVDSANISNSPLRDGLDNQKLQINNIIAILLITDKTFNNTWGSAMKN